jgi:hypothetical protein
MRTMTTLGRRRVFAPLLAAVLGALPGCGSAGNDDGTGGGTGGTGAASDGGKAGQSAGGSSAHGGSSGKGSSGGDGTGKASGRILWTVTSALPELRGLDTGTHEAVFAVPVWKASSQISAIAVADDYVWLGREDGMLLAVDRAGETLAGEVDVTPVGADEPADIYHIAAGNGFAITAPESNLTPPIVRVEAPGVEIVQQGEVLDLSSRLNGIVYDGRDVWTISGNNLELVRADPETLEVRGRVQLGHDPSEPDGFGDLYGDGYLADTGDTLWVIDTASRRLLSVDKATLTPRAVDDLSDLTDFETSLRFEGNSRGAFLMLNVPGIIVRFDPRTGARLNTYDLSDAGGAARMALASDRLYVKPDGALVYDVREIDIETGEVLQIIHSETYFAAMAVQKE